MVYVMIQLAINCLLSYFLDLMSRSWSAFVECDRPIRITGSYLSRSRADRFWNRAQESGPDHCEKVIGSLISRQLSISRSDRIPRTILLRSDHDPGDPASYYRIGVGSEISSQQLVILSVISSQLNSTNYQNTFTGTWSVLCQQFVYFQ